MLNPAGWAVSNSADNALATATVAAADGKKHIVYSAAAGYSDAVVGKKLTLKVAGVAVWETFIHTSAAFTFPRGIAAPVGVAVSAELDASGVAGTLGAVSLHGVTI